MTLVRRHLRRGVAVWLTCHALTFSALVPRDCCAAHAHGKTTAAAGHAGHEAAAAEPCHETAEAPAPGAHCEMSTADGASCPMHQPGAMPAGCAMTGVCHAPEAALSAVLLQAAVAVPSFTFTPYAVPGALPRATDVSSTSLAVPPDAPPPRL